MILYLHSLNATGTLAQLVEQWTENPCVPGSIPGGTTKNHSIEWFFYFINIVLFHFLVDHTHFVESIHYLIISYNFEVFQIIHLLIVLK